MQKRAAPHQTFAFHGSTTHGHKQAEPAEPALDSLIADPVMQSLWRADRIDPDHAKKLFADTTRKLHDREQNQSGNNAATPQKRASTAKSANKDRRHETNGEWQREFGSLRT